MKQRALNAKQDCLFWSSAKHPKEFSKINDSVKSSIQNRIISNPHVIQNPIENDYIKVSFYYEHGVVNNEIRHKVLLRVSFRVLHIDIVGNNPKSF